MNETGREVEEFGIKPNWSVLMKLVNMTMNEGLLMTSKSDMGRSLFILTGFHLAIGIMYDDFNESGKIFCNERLLAPSLRKTLWILSLPCAFRVFSEQRLLRMSLSLQRCFGVSKATFDIQFELVEEVKTLFNSLLIRLARLTFVSSLRIDFWRSDFGLVKVFFM